LRLYSFPKEERLKKQEDFLRILREGRPYSLSKNFVVYIRKGEKRRIGISVSKKVGTAVVRNRIKRLIREVYRLHRPYLSDNAEILVIVKPGENIGDIIITSSCKFPPYIFYKIRKIFAIYSYTL